MADTTQGLTKRLEFVSLGGAAAGPDPATDDALIQALRQPTTKGFSRCGQTTAAARAPVVSCCCLPRLAGRPARPATRCPARRALELLRGVASQRAAEVQASAVEAADEVGEADLRRLKRQFSSLKNTFLHYEVKNEFLAGAPPPAGRVHGPTRTHVCCRRSAAARAGPLAPCLRACRPRLQSCWMGGRTATRASCCSTLRRR